MFFRMIYDDKLAQAAYLVGCQKTGEAVVIDPLRDVDQYQRVARENGLRITAVAETHIHADFLSGARELAEQGAMVYVSDEGDQDWKYGWLEQKSGGGAYRHMLLHDRDEFNIGNIRFTAVHTPGHTPEHLSYLVTDLGGGASEPMGIITGDFVFVGDLGRPDLLETAAGHAGTQRPSAARLHASAAKLAELPDYLQVWPAHGAGSACGKALGAVPQSTIGYERRFNPALQHVDDAERFIDFILEGQPEPPLYFARMKRDNKLGPAVLGEVPTPPALDAAEMVSLDPRTTAIIDTRRWNDFRAGHLAGSLHLPLTRSFNTDAGSLILESEPIVLIVESARLDEAVRDLIRVGLDKIVGWYDTGRLDALRGAGGAFDTINEVDPAEAARRIESDRPVVLDVRRATEFAGSHLPDAVNIAHTRLRGRLDEVPTDRPVLVNCQSGIRSAKASSLLKRHGYDVINLIGGMNAWNEHAHATTVG